MATLPSAGTQQGRSASSPYFPRPGFSSLVAAHHAPWGQNPSWWPWLGRLPSRGGSFRPASAQPGQQGHLMHLYMRLSHACGVAAHFISLEVYRG